jgi:ribosomal protein S18 acetylase RimI-like enzyme
MGEVRMRLATAADVPGLVALVNSAYRGESSRAGWTTEADLLDGIRIDEARLHSAIASPYSAILVAEEAGRLVACVHLQKTGGDCYLGMLTTLPTVQGRGVGRQVIAAAERWAIDRWQSASMHMTVLVQRPELIAWYERRGYVRTGQQKPFPYGDQRFGLPLRADLAFEVLRKPLRP